MGLRRGAGDVSRETLRNVDSVSRETELDCVELATVFHGFFGDDPTDRPRKIVNRANSVLIPLRGLMPLLRVIWWRSPNADVKASMQGFTALIRGYFWTKFGAKRRFHGKEQSWQKQKRRACFGKETQTKAETIGLYFFDVAQNAR